MATTSSSAMILISIFTILLAIINVYSSQIPSAASSSSSSNDYLLSEQESILFNLEESFPELSSSEELQILDKDLTQLLYLIENMKAHQHKKENGSF
jgi:hypothetical protein